MATRASGRIGRLMIAAGIMTAGAVGTSVALGQNSGAGTGATTGATAGATTGVTSGPVRLSAATANPTRANMAKMMRRISIDLKEQRLEDVIKFITEVTGAEIEPIWSDGTSTGLNKDAVVTLKATNLAALELLERVLTKAGRSDLGGGASTWQFTEYGAIEVGPKERLNETKRTQIYDIKDLLIEIPNFPDAPQIDLEGVLQQSQGGGGGTSPFDDNQEERLSRDELEQRKTDRVVKLLDILRSSVETEQWTDSGGSGGSIQQFQDTLIISAPDYMHRQINGYSWWPAARPMVVGSRRYVSTIMDVGASKVDGFGREPVTAVAGGQNGTGAGGGGGGAGGGSGGSGGGAGGGSPSTPAPGGPTPGGPGSPSNPRPGSPGGPK